MKTRRTKKIKQRGAGFFDAIRAFFTRKKPTTPLAPSVRPITEKRGILNVFTTRKNKNVKLPPFETLEHGLNRIFVFLYKKMKPDVAITEGAFLTKEQRDELRGAIQRAKEKDMEVSQIAEEVFHTPLEQLNKEIRIEEIGYNSKNTTNEKQRKILYPGTNKARRAESYAGSLERLITQMLRSNANLKYKSNVTQHACPNPQAYPEVLSKPITSLTEQYQYKQRNKTMSQNRCIYIAKSPEEFEKYVKNMKNTGINMNVQKDRLVFPYLILHPGFYGKNMKDPDFVLAKDILFLDVFQDALRQKKILEVEPHLAAVLRAEMPDAWKQSGLEAKIISTSQLNTVSLKEMKQGNVVILDIEYLPEGPEFDVVSNIPFNPLVKQAIEDGKLTYMDPYSMYLFRKEQPILYTSAFGLTNMNTYYERTPIEQLVITFLQGNAIVDSFYKQGNNRGGNIPNRPNAKNQYKLKKQLDLYTADLSDESTITMLMAPFRAGLNAPEWRDLLEIQQKVPHDVQETINSADKLEELILHFYQPSQSLEEVQPIAYEGPIGMRLPSKASSLNMEIERTLHQLNIAKEEGDEEEIEREETILRNLQMLKNVNSGIGTKYISTPERTGRVAQLRQVFEHPKTIVRERKTRKTRKAPRKNRRSR